MRTGLERYVDLHAALILEAARAQFRILRRQTESRLREAEYVARGCPGSVRGDQILTGNEETLHTGL